MQNPQNIVGQGPDVIPCDERQPICDRCIKGNRDCVYPNQTTEKSETGSSFNGVLPTSQENPESAEAGDEVGDMGRLEVIPDEDEEAEPPESINFQQHDHTLMGRRSTSEQYSDEGRDVLGRRCNSRTPSLVFDKASPASSMGEPVGNIRSQGRNVEWSQLPPDLQFYLTYFSSNVTYFHYHMRVDYGGFIQVILPREALCNEALLYAIVGFSAFQYSVEMNLGKIQDFLQYYNKAVSLLLKSLKTRTRPTAAILCTILQLATLEEYLGDWPNLLGHLKAAHEILTTLYTPQTITETAMSKAILAWYVRYDVTTAMVGGIEPILTREWLSQPQELIEQQLASNPNDLSLRIEHQEMKTRGLGMDLAILVSQKPTDEYGHKRRITELNLMMEIVRNWKNDMHPSLLDGRFLVIDSSNAIQRHPEVFKLQKPALLYTGPLWITNALLMDWMATALMYGIMATTALQERPDTDYFGSLAYDWCLLFEATTNSPEAPKGVIPSLSGGIALAATFLPRDEANHMWIRRTLAKRESHGCVQLHTYRERMSLLLRDDSVKHWWLPNDELYYPLIRSLRRFAEERSLVPKMNDAGQDLHDLKAFSLLNLSDEDGTEPIIKEGKPAFREASVASSSEWSPAQRNIEYDQDDFRGTNFNNKQASWSDEPGPRIL